MQMSEPHIGISLGEFTSAIRDVVADAGLSAWVFGEVKNYKYNRHAYFSLIETQEGSNVPVASLSCTVWSFAFDKIIGRFEREAGVEMRDGLKVLVHLTVGFHPAYGLSANVDAIDATYTLGEYELKRKQTIEQLTQDGYMDLQKQLELPTFIRRVAIISANTAAGYGDFMNQLSASEYGGCECQLYPALMQGTGAPESIINALGSIQSDLEEMVREFDAVVIIRGGGSKQDLACFDDYVLATYIATFPLPIITGIGHEQDTSVVDMVAFQRVKTPTAAAEYIIDHNSSQYTLVEDYKRILSDAVARILSTYNNKVAMKRQQLSYIASSRVDRLKMQVENLHRRIGQSADMLVQMKMQHATLLKNKVEQSAMMYIQMEQRAIVNYMQQLEALDPQKIVNRGYTMTLSKSGKLLSSIEDVEDGEQIVTLLRDGRLTSVVKK
ncbi:MAG: exodeoxyribonuclease VII large subunit [Bacteroidales bacterium]|nr:exodeoxyribonuclease VII large subunit [Bacteroidales bacterium]